MDYIMNGITARKAIYEFETDSSPNSLSTFNPNLTINNIDIDSNDSKFGNKCLRLDSGSYIYIDSPFNDDSISIPNKSFTIDFWFKIPNTFTEFDSSADLSKSDDYSKNCNNPYFFVYGIKDQQKLLDVIKSYTNTADYTIKTYIPLVTALGYDSKNQKMFLETIHTQILEKQSGVTYPEDIRFFTMNNHEYYIQYNTTEYNNGKQIEYFDISVDKWHHLSLSFNKDDLFGPKLRIDFGDEIASGLTFEYDGSKSSTPDIPGPLSFGKYGKAFFRDENVFFSIGNQTIPYEQDWLEWELSTQGKTKEFGSLYIDNLRLVDDYISIIPDKRVVIIDNNAYGIRNGNFEQLAVNWSLLSANQRLQCVKILDQEAYPSIAQIQSVYNSNHDVYIESYTAEYTSTFINIRMDSDHKAVVEPKRLYDMKTYGTIEQVTAEYEIENNGIIKIAPTNDLVNGVYFGYDFDLFQWKAIAASEIEEKGILISQIGAIPKSSWALLGDKLAFGYYIESELEEIDIAKLKSINILTTIEDSEEESSDINDYEYSYITPSKMLIKFLTDGSYKVNYLDKEV